MSPDKELLKKICTQGLCIHGELVRYVPCYDDSLWIKFRNISLEAGDAELAEILQDHGGKIIDIQRQYIKVQGIQILTGWRQARIKKEGFMGLPHVLKCYEGCHIGIKYNGQPDEHSSTVTDY